MPSTRPPTASTYAGTEPSTKHAEPIMNSQATDAFSRTGRARNGVSLGMKSQSIDSSDRLAPRRDAELAVQGKHLALHGVARDEQPLTDLAEREMSREQRDQPQLCGGERRSTGRDTGQSADVLA